MLYFRGLKSLIYKNLQNFKKIKYYQGYKKNKIIVKDLK